MATLMGRAILESRREVPSSSWRCGGCRLDQIWRIALSVSDSFVHLPRCHFVDIEGSQHIDRRTIRIVSLKLVIVSFLWNDDRHSIM
jgi:hypothetical protein